MFVTILLLDVGDLTSHKPHLVTNIDRQHQCHRPNMNNGHFGGFSNSGHFGILSNQNNRWFIDASGVITNMTVMLSKMTVVWPKWPLFYHQNDRRMTKMTVRLHKNDRYFKFTPNDRYLKKTPKWPMFMFERLHRYRGLNVLATSQATNIKC